MGFLSASKPVPSIDQCCCSCRGVFFFLRPRIVPSSTPPPLPHPISVLNPSSSSSSTRKSLLDCHSSRESSLLMTKPHLHNATTVIITPPPPTKLHIARKRRRRSRRSYLVSCNNNDSNTGGNNNEDENDSGPRRQPVLPSARSAGVAPSVAEEDKKRGGGGGGEEEEEEAQAVSPENKAIINACLVGLFTGIVVVLFNIAVHEIRDVFWDGIPDRGASWLREEPIGVKWGRVILIPACGGLLVSMLKLFQSAIEEPKNWNLSSNAKATLEPVFKTMAACVTLGTGNSLGPEGPSVEIGTSIAKGVGTFFDNSSKRKLSLKAAGSAAGISSGFNAAVAGCFFAVESVLWPSPAESSSSLTNTTSMVILSAVIASVVSEIGLGSEPTFMVPNYDFRSPSGFI